MNGACLDSGLRRVTHRVRSLARLGLVASAVSFGPMALLARRLSQPARGFSAGHLAVLRFVVGAAGVALTVAGVAYGTVLGQRGSAPDTLEGA